MSNSPMRKLLLLTFMLLLSVPAMAQEEEGKIKAAVEDRYKDGSPRLIRKTPPR